MGRRAVAYLIVTSHMMTSDRPRRRSRREDVPIPPGAVRSPGEIIARRCRVKQDERESRSGDWMEKTWVEGASCTVHGAADGTFRGEPRARCTGSGARPDGRLRSGSLKSNRARCTARPIGPSEGSPVHGARSFFGSPQGWRRSHSSADGLGGDGNPRVTEFRQVEIQRHGLSTKID